MSWTLKLEQYFSSTGERAHCLAWAHQRAEMLYSIRRTFIDLPVIVLSSVTGFLSVGSSSMFKGQEMQASMALGGVSLFVSILNTMGSYFGWSRLAEAHRISAIHYSKLYRFISVEMALPREERASPSEFLKYTKEQYDRLSEISPLLPDLIIKEFKDKFTKESLEHISVPEQMNGLEAIKVYCEKDLETDLEVDLNTKRIEKTYNKQARNISSSNSSHSGTPLTTESLVLDPGGASASSSSSSASKFMPLFPTPPSETFRPTS